MRLTAILLLAGFIQVSANGEAQSITYSGKNVSLEKVFAAIKKQTNYVFFYRNDDIEKAHKVTIDLKDVTVQKALENIFKNQPLTFSILDNTIVVKQKAVLASPLEGDKGDVPPPIDITGKVTDADGNPLAGATVKVKGSNKGTTTNSDGVFVLKGVAEDATMEISFVGYETYTVAVSNNGYIIASLKVKPENLNEVVINKGYYTEKQMYSVSNVGRITAKDIEKQPVNNLLLAIQGRVPGIFITQSSGLPGSGITVRVEGQNSLKRGSDPLYVIDGVPYTSQLLPNLGGILGLSAGYGQATGNPLSYINPLDIESIEILKDADATSIYGSRAANGAILITTKKGKIGQMKVDVNIQSGVGHYTSKLKLLNTQEYLEMRHEAKRNDNASIRASDYDMNGAWDSTRNTDWQEELLGKSAKYTDIQTNVSGGSETIQYFIGTNYHKETTVFPGDLYDRKGSVHFSLNTKSTNNRFQLQLSGNYLLDDNHLIGVDLTNFALTLPPNAPNLLNDDGTLNWALTSTGSTTWGSNGNPLVYLFNEYRNKTSNLTSNATSIYRINKTLELRGNFGYTNMQTHELSTIPLSVAAPADRPFATRTASYGNNNINSWIIEPQINYTKKIGKGIVESLAGVTLNHINSNREQLNGSGYLSDALLSDIKAAANVTVPIGGTIASVYKYCALFARLNFNWDQKHILNLSIRRDGSSRFGSKNQFQNFGSVGYAWLFSNEKFVRKLFPFLSFGKLKASYGTTGNDQIGDYQFLDQYSSLNPGVPYQGVVALTSNGIPNPYLAWEQTDKLFLGLSLGFIRDKILFEAGYSQNRSSNNLLFYSIPNFTGETGLYKNFPATIQNTSLELSLNALIFNRVRFKWNSYANMTVPHNKLIEFDDLATSSYSRDYIIGQPFTITMVDKFLGVNPATGEYQFSTSLADRIPINTSPDFYGGIGNTIAYKEFSLDFLFQFVKQIALTITLVEILERKIRTNLIGF